MAINGEQRDALLEDYWSLHRLWRAGGDPARGLDAAAAKAERDARRLEYFDGLPVIAMSRCPHCEAELQAQFDPWGLDGFWWQERELGATREPQSCSHFRLLTGALSLQDMPPLGGEHPAHPGPDVPYVVPEILAQETAIAVIASVTMANGYLAYPIAYFSLSQSIPAASLAPTWRRTTCSFTAPGGGAAWSPRTAPWDFDLGEWIEQDKLRWIVPGDSSMRLRNSPPCPYLDLPGERMNQVVKQERLRLIGPPTGDSSEPFSP